MRVEYSRNLTVSHMILEQSEQLEDWERKMIKHNKVKGVLFAESVEENEQKRLWYDITGKQGLDVILDNKELTYILLCNILKALYEIVERIESVLLEPQALLLLPECIFLDHTMECIYFCYYPGNETDLKSSFLELMGYLLKKLQHEDERAVNLAYEIYDSAIKGTFSFSDLKKLVHMPYEKDETEPEFENTYEESLRKQAGKQVEEEPEDTKKNQFMQWIKKLQRRFLGTVCEWKQGREETFVFEPDKEEEEIPVRPTVLLHTADLPEGILRYEGKNEECKDLNIKEFPYIIGSGDGCKGYIPSNTVSRIHARITQTEDVYFIEDLNSANGTMVGGTLLNCKVRMSLQKNEIIIFADEKFRFI